ncbi:MAG: hypothetical protein HOE30_18935 [Deltaproteobacteria bacterium]|nr:hypothetical protein [Deltaproteobacteria bacterium]MBT4266431.1 hypothetical protein [Deltaproteobacteria bacterium]MBT4640366.1 hypothetical protein [Deltaproteobacteria bacterium]MBT6500707.1 hypothetical protein [Deltaproteobacteria bacterium]MBT6611966.1 hypothetical protein [Deltaproteobacteria bacterium]
MKNSQDGRGDRLKIQGGRVLILPPEKIVDTDRLIYSEQSSGLPEVDLAA